MLPPGALEIIALVAEAFKLNVPDIAQEYGERKRRRQRVRREEELNELAMGEKRIQQERLGNQLLKIYYSDEDLNAHNLARYTFSAGRMNVETNIAVQKDWLSLTLPLGRNIERFQVSPPKWSAPSLTAAEAASWIIESEERGIRFQDDPVFSLQDFAPQIAGSPICFSVGRYLEYRLTFGALENEDVRSLMREEYVPERCFERRAEPLTLRNKLLPDCAALAHFGGRICVGGVNVVFACRRPYPDNDFAFFMAERSNEVASARGALSLIPSGFHQPYTEATAPKEVPLSESVIREIAEELFHVDEAVSNDGHMNPSARIRSYPQVQWFSNHPGQFSLEVVSFGLSLKDGSYQFGVLLAVDNPDYWVQFEGGVRPNYEFRHTGSKAIDVSTKDVRALTSILTNPLCSNASAFTIVEALRRLKDLEPTRVILPEIEPLTRWGK